jgi:uncharacterized integral membrane protein
MSATPESARREQSRRILAAALGGLGVLFAALNFDEVEVNWILGTWETPLVIVIALSFLLGAGPALRVASRRAKRRG